MKEQPNCDCGKPSGFFHSRCCNAHFEGVIYENGKWAVICEKCNKFGAFIQKEMDADTLPFDHLREAIAHVEGRRKAT